MNFTMHQQTHLVHFERHLTAVPVVLVLQLFPGQHTPSSIPWHLPVLAGSRPYRRFGLWERLLLNPVSTSTVSHPRLGVTSLPAWTGGGVASSLSYRVGRGVVISLTFRIGRVVVIRGLVWCGRGVISLTEGVRRVVICLPGQARGMVLSLWERVGWGWVTIRPTTHLWAMIVNICSSC